MGVDVGGVEGAGGSGGGGRTSLWQLSHAKALLQHGNRNLWSHAKF
jgi:hypothetical protein